ncbi:hypothetical protein SAY87_003665 [Trapa incisa]|uniref:TF-B3 domain-containing protein n=1 Tax=Trapa incisa TaxID=236973 RepID=A0AAN7KP99_9MYRT|nr:hypothetical protein SAY87_003665 [Trapa incisa]
MPARENIPMSRGEKHKFFKVFLQELSGRRMRIPPAFQRHMEGNNSGTVYLIGPSRNRWIVKLIEEDGHLYLSRGWTSFVMDHGIQHGHFLVFEYDGADTFNVTVFGPSDCEEMSSLRTKPSRGSKVKQEEPEQESGAHDQMLKEDEGSSSKAGDIVVTAIPTFYSMVDSFTD